MPGWLEGSNFPAVPWTFGVCGCVRGRAVGCLREQPLRPLLASRGGVARPALMWLGCRLCCAGLVGGGCVVLSLWPPSRNSRVGVGAWCTCCVCRGVLLCAV